MWKEKTKFQQVFKNFKRNGFFHIFGSSIINQMVTFLSGIILIRILSKAEYGLFAYVNNIMAFILLLSGFGITSGLLQICSETKEEQETDKLFVHGFKTAVKINVILCLIIFSIARLISFKLDGADQLLMLMSMLPIGILIYELIQIYFRYNKMNRKFSYYASFNTSIILIASILGAIALKVEGLILFRYAGYIVSIIVGVIYFGFPIKKVLKGTKIDKFRKFDLYKISIVSMANNATGHLIYLLDVFIVGLLIPNESIIASYKVATIIPNALIFIPGALMVYFYPHFAEHNKDKAWVRRNFISIIKYFGIFNLILSLILLILAPFIIRVIFGVEYLDAILPFRILVIGYAISATFRKIAGNLLVTQRKLRFNFWLGIFEGGINIIGNLFLINKFGSLGAAISSLIVVSISSIIGVNYFLKITSES